MKKVYAFMVLCAVILLLQGCDKKDVVKDEPNNETGNNSTITDGANLASGDGVDSVTDKSWLPEQYDTFEEGLTGYGYKYERADASHFSDFGAVEGRKYSWDDDVVEVYRYNDNDSRLAAYKASKKIDVDGYDDYHMEVHGNHLFVYKTKTAADKLKGLFNGFN